MHAKTETNATILSLLYPASPSRGVFKIFEKKRKIPRKSKQRGIIRTKIRHFLGYPATPSGVVPESLEK